MRRLRWVSAIAWVFSWRVIYLEIVRWHHMTPTLRFNAPPPLPGVDRQPQPGLPLIAIRGCAVLAPIVCITTLIAPRSGNRGRDHELSLAGTRVAIR
jgi:hypothetical protein